MGKLKEIIEKIKAAIAQLKAKIMSHPKLAKFFAHKEKKEEKAPSPHNPTVLFKEGGPFTRFQLVLVAGLLLASLAALFLAGKLIFNRMQKAQTLQANSGQYQSELEDYNKRVRDNASIISLGNFTTNTVDDRQQKVRVKVDLWAKFSDPDTAAYADSIAIKVNDRITTALTRVAEADISLLNDQGKKVLRDEIKRQVGPLLRQGKIIDVYFHNLVAQ